MLPFAGNAGTMQYYSTRPGAVVSVSHQTKGVSPEIKPNFHSPSGPSSRSHRDQECTSTFYCQGCRALIPLGNNLHTVDTCMDINFFRNIPGRLLSCEPIGRSLCSRMEIAVPRVFS